MTTLMLYLFTGVVDIVRFLFKKTLLFFFSIYIFSNSFLWYFVFFFKFIFFQIYSHLFAGVAVISKFHRGLLFKGFQGFSKLVKAKVQLGIFVEFGRFGLVLFDAVETKKTLLYVFAKGSNCCLKIKKKHFYLVFLPWCILSELWKHFHVPLN